MTPDDSVLAAELALGLLDGEDRAAALRRALAEPDFAREVDRWRDHFVMLLAEVPAADPPAHLFDRIAPPAANDDRATPWRWATAGASAVAAGLALLLVMRPTPAPVAPPVIAQAPAPAAPLTAALAPTPGETGAAGPFAALYDVAGGEVRIAAGVTPPAGKVAQLWRIGADGVPHALGLLQKGRATAIPLSRADRAALAAGATLAVSIEPPGGSPKPTPTGPVVATGKLLRI